MIEPPAEHEPFEQLLVRFDELVASLESDNLSLSQAIETYESAAQIARRCTTILQEAELRVRSIDDELDRPISAHDPES